MWFLHEENTWKQENESNKKRDWEKRLNHKRR